METVCDYKKKNRDLYNPKTTPSLIKVPEMNFAAVDGQGNPNEPGGEYQKAVEALYSILYTIKMCKKTAHVPDGYFDFVVPPLEGLWWLSDANWSIKDKSKYKWTSMIRLPEFVNKEVFKWAKEEAARKKKISTDNAYFYKFQEGLCVQCMHIGPFDNEPQTLALMKKYTSENNLMQDLNDKRKHHEIYLLNFLKIDPNKMKTVLRIPVKKADRG